MALFTGYTASVFNVEVQGLPALIQKLAQLDKALNVTHILDEAGAFLLNVMRQRFMNQTSPDNTKWRRSHAAIRRNGKTLFDTGRLFHSIQLFKSPVPDTATSGERLIATDVPYAPYHQFGTTYMVRRQFLGFNDNDADLVEKLLMRRLTQFGI